MLKTQTFTNLKIWQESNHLAVAIYRMTDNFPRKEMYSFTDQIRRAATSVGANIAEGFGRFSNKEKVRFLYISRGSIYEVQNFLYLAVDLGYADRREASDIIGQYELLVRSINALIKRISS